MTTYFATKYDSARDEVIALLSDEAEGYGMRDDSTGDSEAPGGYFALVILDDSENQCDGTDGHAGHGPQAHSCDLDFADTTGAYPVGDEAGEIARTYGVMPADVRGAHIVTHNSQGFVSVETFADEATARDEFTCRAARYAEWSDEDRDEDGDGAYICPVTGHGYHTV